jgi:hypothetical protein
MGWYKSLTIENISSKYVLMIMMSHKGTTGSIKLQSPGLFHFDHTMKILMVCWLQLYATFDLLF